MARLSKPSIAMIRGYCIGGGMAVALTCDLRVCSEESRFAIPAARLGLGYGYDGLKALADVVGPSFAKEILFTARQFSADEALRVGLVNRIAPPGDEGIRRRMRSINSSSPMRILGMRFTCIIRVARG